MGQLLFVKILEINRKKVFVILIILTIIILLLPCRKNELGEREKFSGTRKNFTRDFLKGLSYVDSNKIQKGQLVCQIPNFIPFGKDYKRLRLRDEPICYSESNLKFRIDFQNNLIQLEPNSSFFQENFCYYQAVFRDPRKQDLRTLMGSKTYSIARKFIKLESDLDHIYVWCQHKTTGNKTYEDYLSSVQLKPALEAELSKLHSSIEEFYSVMIIGQDSSSNMNFHRFMPKTRKYLMNEMNAVEFTGFNSLGPGTLWSVLALFTGLDLNQYRNLCWPKEKGYQDDCPHIWKDFMGRGYRSAYDEDALHMGIFNEVGKKGFQTSQFHYDFRVASSKYSSPATMKGHPSDPDCYGSRLSFDVLLENMARMATTFHDRPFWSFMWAQSLSHSLSEYSKFSERGALQTLKYLHGNQLLNNTFIIFFSDHGARYGEFRKRTRQGFLEERLPILYIALPPKFRQRYAQATKNLRQNAEKLTTAFDVYEMMKDLLNLTQLTPSALQQRARIPLTSRKVSLFLPIDNSRTCEHINFSFVYCACLDREEIPAADKDVQIVARHVMKQINKNLTNHQNCMELKLKNITQAFSLGVQVSEKDEYDRFKMRSTDTEAALGKHFQIGIETEPGRGAYDVSVLMKGRNYIYIDDITRVTEYGHDADCINIKSLKPFCTCKN